MSDTLLPPPSPDSLAAETRSRTEVHYRRGKRDGMLDCARMLTGLVTADPAPPDAFRARVAMVALDLFTLATEP